VSDLPCPELRACGFCVSQVSHVPFLTCSILTCPPAYIAPEAPALFGRRAARGHLEANTSSNVTCPPPTAGVLS
jgi:hypothetical protein